MLSLRILKEWPREAHLHYLCTPKPLSVPSDWEIIVCKEFLLLHMGGALSCLKTKLLGCKFGFVLLVQGFKLVSWYFQLKVSKVTQPIVTLFIIYIIPIKAYVSDPNSDTYFVPKWTTMYFNKKHSNYYSRDKNVAHWLKEQNVNNQHLPLWKGAMWLWKDKRGSQIWLEIICAMIHVTFLNTIIEFHVHIEHLTRTFAF